MAETVRLDQIELAISAAVDPTFYNEVYGPLEAATHPVVHFVQVGWREGNDPAPWFSTEAYLTANGDVASADVNPFHHFLIAGRREGREIAASAHAEAYFSDPLRRGAGGDWGCGVPPPAARRRTPPGVPRR